MIFINHKEILDGRVAVVEVSGPLNRDTSPDLEYYINEFIDKDIRFILFDFGDIKYVSSEGIGVMLFIQKKIADSKGFLVLFNLSPEIASLYSILGFDKVIRVAESRAEAVQIMDRQIELSESGAIYETGTPKELIEDTGPVEDDGNKDSVEISESDIEHRAISDGGQFVIECEKCGSLIRIRRAGDFLCPECKTEFTVNSDQTVRFKQA